MTDFFSIDKAMKTSTESRKTAVKNSVEVPKSLAAPFSLFVACKRIMAILEPKMKLAEARVKEHTLREWVTEFVRTNSVPSSTTYTSKESSIQFIPTKRIFMKSDTIVQLEAMKIPIRDYIKIGAVQLDFSVLEKHNLVEKAQAALMGIEGMTPEIMGELIKPKMEASESLYPNLIKLARESLPNNAVEKDIIDRAIDIVKIVQPVTQMKNATAPFSLSESMELVESVDIES